MLQEKQILDLKQYGDLSVVAQLLSKKHNRHINSSYVQKILERKGSKLYKDAIEALRTVVESREEIYQNYSK